MKMNMRSLVALLFVLSPLSAQAAALTAEGERFVLTLDGGKRLTSTELVGAELTTLEGAVIRIDAVTPSKENPRILLHSLSSKDPATGAWTPTCDADAYGRRAGFPIAGRWDDHRRYIKDKTKWFLTCTGGSRGKCVLWGYDPWGKGPKGQDLTAYYRACQHTVRADYDGTETPHTKNGTQIDLADDIGIQTATPGTGYVFEAGWAPTGAVCVAHTRWGDLLTLEALLKTAPRLGGRCDEVAARRRGALIYTRVKR